MVRHFAAALALSASLLAQSPGPAQVAQIFGEFQHRDSPGCVAGVEAAGHEPWFGAYGMADLEHDVANTPATVFEVGSVSKQFTAAAVLLLAERRRLSLDDNIRKYFPELASFRWHITVRHLLSHTSGLRDWGEIVEIAGWPRGTREYTQADVLDVISRQKELNYAPGDAWSYTNSGYNLAAMLVERVSGMSMQEFCRKEFFTPLGMNSTQWRDSFRRVVRNRAIAYVRHGSEWSQYMPFENAYGNGGLLTTVGDLLKWNRNLASGKLHPAVFKLMQEPSTLNNGAKLGYGLGFFLEQYGGVAEVAHAGTTAAYVAWLGRLPAKDISIAVACNAGSADTTEIAHRLAHVFSTLPAEKKPMVSNDIKDGLYRSMREHSTVKLERTGSGLRLDGWPNKLNVRSEGTKIIFENPVFGDDAWERVESWKAKDLSAFAGLYTSDEAEAALRFVIKDNKLVVRNSPHSSFVLEPKYEDDFECDIGNLRFARNQAGKVVGLRLSGDRIWDLYFARENSAGPRQTTAIDTLSRGNTPVAPSRK